MEPQAHSFEVSGGRITALRFGDGPHLVLAAHGITSTAMSWPAVAQALPADWSLVAVDLRGRGHSRDLPGPFGLRVHAADLCRIAEALRAGTPTETPDGTPSRATVLAGHSMGAFVAVHAAHARPDLFTRVVLVDGGVALPVPPDMEPDQVLDATLGPAIARLAQTYPSVDAYVDFFKAHPALADSWSQTVEAYVRYDALETPEGVRARAVEDAVRTDGRELLVTGAEFQPEVLATPLPITILAAPYGMFGQPGGLLPAAGLAAYDEVPHVRVETVPDTNHYTIMFDPAAAARIAAAITG